MHTGRSRKGGKAWGPLKRGPAEVRTLAQWLRERVSDSDLTLRELAEVIPYGRETISKNLNGLSRPQWRFVQKLVIACAGSDARARQAFLSQAKKYWDAASPVSVAQSPEAPFDTGTESLIKELVATLRDAERHREAAHQAVRAHQNLVSHLMFLLGELTASHRQLLDDRDSLRSELDHVRAQSRDLNHPHLIENIDRRAKMLTFAFPSGIGINSRLAGAVASCLRKAVMRRFPDPLPPEITGHSNDVPHVAYLPLLDAGRPEASGNLVGVGILLPPGCSDLAALVEMALLSGPEFHLAVSGTRLPMRPGPHNRVPLIEKWWSHPARIWATVTPIVLDRFSGKGREPAEISRECVQMGLPRPSFVAVDRDPLTHGGARIGRRNLARQEKYPRPFTHAKIEFSCPVSGPVLLGAQRYLGMGLCIPLER